MGKRRGEDAGINMQARREDVEANASREGDDDPADSQSGMRRQTDNSEPRQRRKLKPRANNSDKPRPALSNPFGSLNLVPSAAAPKLNFGGSTTSASSSSSTSTPAFGFGGNKPAASPAVSAQNLKVAALNTSFSKWVQKQMRERPNELWINGFEDYLTHVAKIKAENANGSSGSKNGSNGFATTTTTQKSSSPSFPPASSSSMFGGASNKTSPPSKPLPVFSNIGQGSENQAPALSLFGASSSSSSSTATAIPSSSMFGNPVTSSPAPAATSSSMFGGSSTTPAPVSSSMFGGSPSGPAAGSSSLFGGSPVAPASGSSSLFGGASSTSGSLFGGPATTTPAAAPSSSLFGAPAAGGSLFGAPLGGGSAGGSLFGAPLGGAAGGAATAADDDDGDEGGANEPTEVVLKSEDADEETLFEVLKCKVLWQLEGGAWDKTPTGRLVVLRNKNNDSRRIVVRGEGTGKPVFNAPLASNTGLNKSAKSVTIVAINYRTVNGQLIGDDTPKVYQIKVKPELLSTLFERIQSALPAAK